VATKATGGASKGDFLGEAMGDPGGFESIWSNFIATENTSSSPQMVHV